MKNIFFFLCLLSVGVRAQQTQGADTVLAQARAQAAAGQGKILLIFHASWCGWCHRMDSIIERTECKPLFDKSYVVCHLDVMEMPAKKSLENPGAIDFYNKYTGNDKGMGLPFWVVLDASGTVLADSRLKDDGIAPTGKGASIGCPAEPNEVAYFAKVLKGTTALTDAEINTIATHFRK